MLYLSRFLAHANRLPSLQDTIEPYANSAKPVWSFGITVLGFDVNWRSDCSNTNCSPKSLKSLSEISGWSGFNSLTNCLASSKILLLMFWLNDGGAGFLLGLYS